MGLSHKPDPPRDFFFFFFSRNKVILGGSSRVCVLHIQPFPCACRHPAHNQCPCRFFSPPERHDLCEAPTTVRHKRIYLQRYIDLMYSEQGRQRCTVKNHLFFRPCAQLWPGRARAPCGTATAYLTRALHGRRPAHDPNPRVGSRRF